MNALFPNIAVMESIGHKQRDNVTINKGCVACVQAWKCGLISVISVI